MPKILEYTCAICGKPAQWRVKVVGTRLIPGKVEGRREGACDNEWFCEEHYGGVQLTWPGRKTEPTGG